MEEMWRSAPHLPTFGHEKAVDQGDRRPKSHEKPRKATKRSKPESFFELSFHSRSFDFIVLTVSLIADFDCETIPLIGKPI